MAQQLIWDGRRKKIKIIQFAEKTECIYASRSRSKVSEGCQKYQHRNIKNINIGITGVPRRREGYWGGGWKREWERKIRSETIFEEIAVRNSPNLMKNINLHIHNQHSKISKKGKLKEIHTEIHCNKNVGSQRQWILKSVRQAIYYVQGSCNTINS